MPNSSNSIYTLISKWLLICVVVGVLVGSVSALFLVSLEWVTNTRNAHSWLVYLLPITGLLMVLSYKAWGKGLEKGTDMVFEAYESPNRQLPARMGFMIVVSTLISHLFGASVGREGTAVQYGAVISTQFNRIFHLSKEEKRIVVMIGVAAGFGSLFGTPWAGAVFALEVVRVGWFRWKGIVPILLTTFLANYVCSFLGAKHTIYSPIENLTIDWISSGGYFLLAAVLFGFVAILFVYLGDILKKGFAYLPNSYIAPLVAGLLVMLVQYYFGDAYLGLGIPVIKMAFVESLPLYAFLIKLVLTIICLRAGFKGGEVTPLFFIGAAFGNALCYFVPLPVVLMAGLGFIAVFAGCTKTPLACSIMGMELFGTDYAFLFLITCFISYYVSGRFGIYDQRHKLPYML